MSSIRPATVQDAVQIAPLLREADRQEIEAAVGVADPRLVLPEAVRTSAEAYAAGPDGADPCILYGVQTVYGEPGLGLIWMVCTPTILSHQIEFLRASKRHLEELNTRFPLLFNRADERNTAHLKWLRWLGFSMLRRVPHGAAGLPFIEFARLKPCA